MGVCGIKVRFVCVLFDICANERIVVFRMVVFRPFTSEVVIAKVKSSDEDGIRCTSFFPSNRPLTTLSYTVTIGFFDDMHIPAAYLPQPSALYVPYPLLCPFHILTPLSAPQRPKRTRALLAPFPSLSPSLSLHRSNFPPRLPSLLAHVHRPRRDPSRPSRGGPVLR